MDRNITSFRESPVCNITTLRLTRSSALPRTLEVVLQHCLLVTVLEYYCVVATFRTPFKCNGLRSALLPLRHALKDLTIYINVFADEALKRQSLRRICKGSLGSLKDFVALTSLNVSFAVLYRQAKTSNNPPLADMLLPSLENLTINDNL